MKHLNALAEQMTNNDFKQYSWMEEENRQAYFDNNLKELKAIRKALLSGRYYTCVEKVSSSGMSRTIKIAYIADNKLHGVGDDIYKLAGCDKNHRISGCGMDMLFAAQYKLFKALCPDRRYQSDMKQYNSL